MLECKKNDKCNEEICVKKCENVGLCPWDSKINMSRHAMDCNNKCIKIDNCQSSYCYNSCKTCGKDCFWLSEETSNASAKHGKPLPPNIQLMSISYNGTNIRLRWWEPSTDLVEILGYVSLTYKTFSQTDGVKIDWIPKSICSNYCEYIITDLKPNENYTIGIKSYNLAGTGQISNLISFKTVPKIINTSIMNNVELTSKEENDNYEICPNTTSIL